MLSRKISALEKTEKTNLNTLFFSMKAFFIQNFSAVQKHAYKNAALWY